MVSCDKVEQQEEEMQVSKEMTKATMPASAPHVNIVQYKTSNSVNSWDSLCYY